MDDAGDVARRGLDLLRGPAQIVQVGAFQRHGGLVHEAGQIAHGAVGGHGNVHIRGVGQSRGVDLYGLSGAALAVVAAVGGKGGGGRAFHRVQVLAADGHGIEIEGLVFAEHLLDEGHPLLHDFQSGAGLELAFDADIALVDLGDELHVHGQHQSGGAQQQSQADDEHQGPLGQEAAHEPVVGGVDLTQEAADRQFLALHRLEQGEAQGHQGQGHGQGGQQGDDHDEAEFGEHLHRHAAHEMDGQVDHHRGEGGGDDGGGDGLGAGGGRLLVVGQGVPGPEAAFDDHDGAVHHHADGHHQSDGRDHVQGKVEQVHQSQGQQQGQGDGAAHDQAGLQVAEEDEQHQHGQDDA